MPHKIFSISSFSTEREGCLYPGYERFQKQIVRGHCNLQQKESAVSHAKGDPCVPCPSPEAQTMTYQWLLPTAALLGIATSDM